MILKYNWTLKDAVFTKDKGKVFSCFSCGGGSTMGYKLAGFDVIGCNEIDKRMMKLYEENHNPKYAFTESITTFKERKDLPKELYNLDILDGSPPCSSFSLAGNREKDWGKLKKFKEGQELQILDTLFFDFIVLAEKLKPKIVVAENVKGLLIGPAKEYVRNIYKAFNKAGYSCKHFLLNASKMGVPQKRERVFFVAVRKDLLTPELCESDMFGLTPNLRLEFNEKEIPLSDFEDNEGKFMNQKTRLYNIWTKRIEADNDMADTLKRVENKNSFFSYKYLKGCNVLPTITTAKTDFIKYSTPQWLSKKEVISAFSFPLDYDFCDKDFFYVCGMSVPPLMIARLSNEIYKQILSKL